MFLLAKRATLAIAVVTLLWVVVSLTVGQSPVVPAPFLSTPFVDGTFQSGSSLVSNLLLRKLDGSYTQIQILLAPPYMTVSSAAAVADYLSGGFANVILAPSGPAGVGLASKSADGGKFTASGNAGLGFADPSRNRNAISVYLVSPAAVYSSTTLYTVGPETSGVVAADFNGDGVLDLAVPFAGDFNGPPGGVAILLNKGDGTFNASVTYAAGKAPSGVSVFDVNRDGKLDLVVADGSASSINVLLGNGNGTFGAAAPFPVGASTLSVTVADFNGDGNPDIAATTTANSVRILIGNGNGSFSSGASVPTGQFPQSIAVLDFNLDGKFDLAVVNTNSQTVSFYLGAGNGTFQLVSNYAVSNFPTGLIVTDYNKDGKPDILVGYGDARVIARLGHIDILLGRGDGTFQGLSISSTGATGFGVLTFQAVADFNNDGKLDVISNGSTGNALSLLPGNGNGSFAATGTQVQLDPQAESANAAVAGDFNGDGKPDLAVATGGSFSISVGRVSVLLNNGSGLGAPSSFDSHGVNPTGIATGDFDGDGKLDLAVANQKTGTTSVFRGGGNGAFQFLQSYSTGKSPLAVIAADFNGDGRLDLAVTDKGDEFATPRITGAVYILKNNGGGAFATPVMVAAGSGTNPGKIAFGDVNGDGKLDLVVSATGPSFAFLVGILPGNGDGTFQPATLLKTDFGPEELAVRDFDGDGKTDIVVAHCCGDTDLTFFRGNGDGTFPAEVHFTGPPSPIALVAADINKDGAPDIVVGGNNGQVAGLLNSSTNFPCSFQLDKTSLAPFQQGATFVVNIDAGPACNWSVSGLPDWITVSGASSGAGSGNVTLIVAPASAARNATISIGGVNVSVAQTLAPVCDYAVFPGGQTFTSAGGAGNFSVSVNPGCAWSVSGNPSWITINSGSSGSGTASGTFTAAANGGVARTATMTIAGQQFVLEQAASSVPGLTAAGSLAQVASEGGWKFILNEVNLGTSAATARLNFYANGSTPLPLPLTFPQAAAALTSPAALSTASPLLAATLDRTINPNAQLLIESTGPHSAAQLIGWGEFLTTGSVSGFGIFNHPGLHWEAVVPLETRNASSYFLAFDNTGQVATGLAIANVSTQSISVQVIIRDDTGAQIGTGSIPLGGKGHTSFMVNEQYTVTAGKRGTVEFQTPQGAQITVLGLRANGNALTTLPVLANVTNAGGLIAHATYNGGFTSIYYLTNTGTSPADFTLSFFNETDGTPLQVPLILPQSGFTTTTSSLTRTIAPKAVLVVQTQAVDLLDSISGSAQLTATGNISGFEIFQWTTYGQEASVPLETRSPSSFLLAFDNTSGLTTGVALSSAAGAPLNVPVILRDDTGAMLQSTSITLSARGHTSFLLPTKYTSVAGKRGLVEFVVPSGNRISVIGLRAKADGTLTTLPVLAK